MNAFITGVRGIAFNTEIFFFTMITYSPKVRSLVPPSIIIAETPWKAILAADAPRMPAVPEMTVDPTCLGIFLSLTPIRKRPSLVGGFPVHGISLPDRKSTDL